jgi:hypothetical protein
VLKGMDLHLLVAFEHNEIMAVSLMVAEEKILAMGRIYLFPVFQRQLDCRQRRMCMKLIAEAVLLKEVEDLGDSFVFHYLEILLA